MLITLNVVAVSGLVIFLIAAGLSRRSVDFTQPHGDECLPATGSDVRRCWDILVPDLKPTSEVPLLIDLHATGGNARSQRELSGFDELARVNGFIAVWPWGVENSWNAGGLPWPSDNEIDQVAGSGCCGFALNNSIDDLQFLKDMIAQIKRNHPVDSERIFITGNSNGCFMAQRAVAQTSNLFSAGACMAGFLLVEPVSAYAPTPMLMIHGDADGVVPYEADFWDGAVVNFRKWAQINGCVSESNELWSSGASRLIESSDCAERSRVGLLTLGGAGHNVYRALDPSDEDIAFSVSEMAWQFLSRQ